MTKLYKFYTIILPNYKMQIYLWHANSLCKVSVIGKPVANSVKDNRRISSRETLKSI